jgi:anti-sigma regulatory factor (Ser/Thr protein kinase)
MLESMRITLPNSAHLQNIQGFLRNWSADDPDSLDFGMHDKWISVHPAVLSMTACLAASVRNNGGTVKGKPETHSALRYLIRMGLFEFLGIDPGDTIQSHEAAGRFIALRQIRTSPELSAAITDLVPLLHGQPQQQDSIRYVLSELTRNALEHSGSPVGAFLCAQYYKKTNRVSIGIADAGIGIRQSITRSHQAHTTRDAVALALQPGITGTTSRLGGTERNAGAGLFYVKSIASLSRNYFVLYSEDTMFKLLKSPKSKSVVLHANPQRDKHLFLGGLPPWRGTVVGIDINMAAGQQLANFLDAIGEAYAGETTNRRRKAYFKQIRFR